MAKKRGGPNKSQAIRDYMDANPTASPAETSKALSAQGIDVSPMFVSSIKSAYRKRKAAGGGPVRRGRKPGRKPGRGRGGRKPRASTGASLSIEQLLKAKQLANQLGGIQPALQALDALARLGG
jgi:hypothetical protein